jgi:hypothetical protein
MEVFLKGCLRIRNGIYYYRRRVPRDLYPKYFKGREISKSLKMSVKKGNLRDARLLAADWDARVDKVFLVCRIKILSYEHKLQAIRDDLY